MNVTLIVLDGLGVGALPDAYEYHEDGANTLINSLGSKGITPMPFLRDIGFSYFFDEHQLPEKGIVGKLAPLTKDNDSGPIHWEMMGIKRSERLPLFPDGLPNDVMSELEERTGYSFIGNVMIERGSTLTKLRDQHRETKQPIVYCTTDSVVQVAAMEEYMSMGDLYHICEVLRELLPNVGRVIAKPFIVNSKGEYERDSKNRKDYMLAPPKEGCLLPHLQQHEIVTIAIGKVGELFQNVGISKEIKTGSNREGIEETIRALQEQEKSFIFTNLVDFDMRGHSNDVEGMVALVKEFDEHLPRIVEAMGDDDLLLMTADHGCDPTQATKTHTREYGMLVGFHKRLGKAIVHNGGFIDLASTIARQFNVDFQPGNVFFDDSLVS